jgi:hypothetical protein
MDQAIRNKLRSVVTLCRRLLEESIAQQLQGKFDIYATGKKDVVKADDKVPLGHLNDEERLARQDILAHFKHVDSLVHKPKESLEQLIREIAYTHLNRLCAYKMMEVRDVYVGGQRFREAVSKGPKSQGFLFYLADHPEDEQSFNAGDQEGAYRHFLNWLGGTLSQEIGVLFSPTDPANRVYPPQRVLDEVLDLLNSEELKGVWSEDETIGWVYQYFTPKELRDQARKESQAPRNSYELAFRNQFFTPRYVVEFLTDNTLGRIWYEMRKGDTRLKDQCRYMVRRPSEVFLRGPDCPLATPPKAEWVKAAARGDFTQLPDEPTIEDLSDFALIHDGYELARQLGHNDPYDPAKSWLDPEGVEPTLPASTAELWIILFAFQRRWGHAGGPLGDEFFDRWKTVYRAFRDRISAADLSQEESLRQVVYFPHRYKKDPREIKILDPACGSGHFLLYCFALLLIVYEEAYDDPDLGAGLQADYPTKDDLRRAMPGLILRHNLHGIDIDLRCTQIAALALWLRCQRAYQQMGIRSNRPPVTRSNIVCAEPMPGEGQLLEEFVSQLEPKLLGQLVKVVFDRMRVAGEIGSLLKIEEEIRGAVAEARRQWRVGPLATQGRLFGEEKPVLHQQHFDLTGISEAQFFEQSESRVIDALRRYAESAQFGHRFQRRLFAEDAVRGLGFVDVCHRDFDVVLMNPPFGDGIKASSTYQKKHYPLSKPDLFAMFVERGLARLSPQGRLGAITSRTGFFLTSLQKWRDSILLQRASPVVFADLRDGVLDSAMVETAAYCLDAQFTSAPAWFVRLTGSEDKEAAIQDTIARLHNGESSLEAFFSYPRTFAQLPGTPFAYWASKRVRDLFQQLAPFESEGRTVKQGLATSDDFRFVRCWWEVPSERLLDASNGPEWNDDIEEFKGWCRRRTFQGKGWVPFVKGGAYSPYYSDVPVVLNWHNDGEELKAEVDQKYGHIPAYHTTWVVKNPDFYFLPGVTWPLRGTRLSVQVVPAGACFSIAGKLATTSKEAELRRMVLVMNSSVFDHLVCLFAGKVGGVQYEVGLIGKIAMPSQANSAWATELAKDALKVAAFLDTFDETSHLFSAPLAMNGSPNSLREALNEAVELQTSTQTEIKRLQDVIDALVFEAYGLSESDIVLHGGSNVLEDQGDSYELSNVEDEQALPLPIGERRVAGESLSYCVGCIFGRWDVRRALSVHSVIEVNDPFQPLPVFSPGMLNGSDGLPIVTAPPSYPLPLIRDGLLIDDPDHIDDIIRRVRDVLDVIWKDRTDSIEKEACEILGVADLRDYFRKPGAGGFWDDHIKRYSKSRRKAPIYWLLQSSKKNYSLWIYYHRLDKDILFKALLNYVEPKIRREESRLDELRSQKIALGSAAKGAKKIDKDIDRQESFLTELRDFEEKLRRAANYHLEPDVNDGVVLNIAPLRELVPWKEAKAYWDDLMDGKYEWSSIGKQLREKGLVK